MDAAEPGDFPLEARLANLLRDIAQAEETAAKTKPEPRGRT